MKIAIIIFISITLSLNFVSSLVTIGIEKDSHANRYDCIWNALIVFAWGCLLRWWVV